MEVCEQVPFFNGRCEQRTPSLSKMVDKKGKGLDVGADPPRKKLCSLAHPLGQS